MRSDDPRSGTRHGGAQHPVRWGLLGMMIGTAAFVVTGAALTAGARVMARMPLTPQSRQRDDATIRAVHPDRVHLDATPETQRPGHLALRQHGGAVHVRLGDVIGHPTPTTVARPVLARDAGNRQSLEIGPAGTNGFYWAGDPRSAHGMEFTEIPVHSPVGVMPAWLVPGTGSAADTWAILVHGHGATRGEALRMIPLLHELGLTTLTITYRNDVGAAPSIDRMHHLGADEWEDLEAAIGDALDRGAQRIVLMGWSMGGGIVLRTSVLSAHRDRIAALVLDSPAVDWQDILTYHALQVRAPRPMRNLALWMMRSGLGARLVHLHEPIALEQMTPGFYAEHLQHPALLLHAMEDRTVPPGPSALLADARPDLVTYVPVPRASHTREWNTDPEGTERTVARFLVDVLGLAADAEALDLPVRDPAAPPQAHSFGKRL